jgi:hypothetical protein
MEDPHNETCQVCYQNMKTILEIFYIRIVGKNVRYQRKVANLSRRGGDPDARIRSLIHEKRRTDSGEIEEQEFVVHSTSWRYEQPGKILLTYAAYSDELEFKPGTFKSLSLKRLRTIQKQSHQPRSQTELHNKVVSHAIRHIAFLIQVGNDDFESTLAPATVKVLKRIWGNLAGEVLERESRRG